MMNKYKTFEELKEELGDKFEEYMYKANIELLTKIDKVIEHIKDFEIQAKHINDEIYLDETLSNKLLEILGGKE